MIVRYRVEIDMWGRRVGVPDPNGEFVLFVPDHVRCDVVRPGEKGSAICTDRSEIHRYKADEYRVYMWTGDDWVMVGYANSWLTEVEWVYTFRPSIWVIVGRSAYKSGGKFRRFLDIVGEVGDKCREAGCVSDFYDVYRPGSGKTLLDLLDWAITRKRWAEFGVV